MATKQRLIEVLTTAMEKPDIANALIQRVINELKKEWVGLTNDEVAAIYKESTIFNTPMYFAQAIEAKLKEKNT